MGQRHPSNAATSATGASPAACEEQEGARNACADDGARRPRRERRRAPPPPPAALPPAPLSAARTNALIRAHPRSLRRADDHGELTLVGLAAIDDRPTSTATTTATTAAADPLECPVCTANRVCVAFSCGHALCAACSRRHMIHELRCPFCARPLEYPRRLFLN